MRKLLIAATMLAGALQSLAGNKIKVYFNNPVNTSVSRGVNATYLPAGTMGDTIVAYINRARYSIDIAQYDYNQSSNYGAYANIGTAVSNAYSRGVTVRWIYDGSSSNTGLAWLNTAIHKVGSPSTSSGIMHDKFIIIDANSSNPDDAIVSTGSEDWSSQQMYKDFNNILFIQDSALAHAYTDEFNMMWGSTTAVPDASHAKFGNAKTNLGRHSFYIEGKLVELIFSPSDGTNTYIQTALASADKDLYLGMYCLTQTAMANTIVAKHNSGVYTLCIADQYTQTASPSVASILSTGLGSSYKRYATSFIYHNKMLIVDPSDPCSDPLVLTGSHNWTTSANSYNDENTLIIHDDTIANLYYQAFYADFLSLGGTVTAVTGCAIANAVPAATLLADAVQVSPNPAAGSFTITYTLPVSTPVSIEIFDLTGRRISSPLQNEEQAPGSHNISCSISTPGMYFVTLSTPSSRVVKSVMVQP